MVETKGKLASCTSSGYLANIDRYNDQDGPGDNKCFSCGEEGSVNLEHDVHFLHLTKLQTPQIRVSQCPPDDLQLLQGAGPYG